MYILYNTENYPDNLLITANSKKILEEILLSLYEEDAHEWYNIYLDYKKAYLSAKNGLNNIYIKELPKPIGD